MIRGQRPRLHQIGLVECLGACPEDLYYLQLVLISGYMFEEFRLTEGASAGGNGWFGLEGCRA